MIKEVLAQMNWGLWQASALVIFMVVMVLVCAWAYRPSAKDKYAAIGARVLDDATSAKILQEKKHGR